MISHNSSKEVIEITQSGGKKKISESKVKFSCHEFFSQIQNSILYLPDTKLVTVPLPYFVFLHSLKSFILRAVLVFLKFCMQTSTKS